MLKKTPEDFRVTERLDPSFIRERGTCSVYRVTKRKLTSLEAAGELGHLLGIPRGEVAMAGLKDRQGVTTQYMSVAVKKPAHLHTPGLKIERVGWSEEMLESRHSLGNSFDVRVRGLHGRDMEKMRDEALVASEVGIPNYFDEQRFGNLRHGEGWIVLDLLNGRLESALKRLVLGGLPRKDEHQRRLAFALERNWRDWRACRDIAGKLGRHHSVFEHLGRDPRDYAGAFDRLSTRVKLIHLYAFQSHLWNRAVAQYIEDNWDRYDHLGVPGIEGYLVYPTKPLAGGDPPETFRLPGPKFEDVENPEHKKLLIEALAQHGVEPNQFEIYGVPGFGIKGEDRPLWLRPNIAPLRAESVSAGQGRQELTVRLRFDLPRGAYATVVVKRLLARSPHLRREFDPRPTQRFDTPRPDHRPGGRDGGRDGREGRGGQDRSFHRDREHGSHRRESGRPPQNRNYDSRGPHRGPRHA